MSSPSVTFMLPPGRLVGGDPFRRQKPKDAAKALEIPADKWPFYVGIAIAKTEPLLEGVFAQIGQAAALGWPGGEAGAAGFAWKYVDGDLPKYADKDGYAGCWVFNLSTTQTIRSVRSDNTPITDADEIKKGFFVDVMVEAKGNAGPKTQVPGVYLNPSIVRLLWGGPIITSAPPIEAMGAAPTAQPVGATALPAPVAPAPAVAPPAAGYAPAPAVAPPAAGYAPAPAVAPPAAGYAPAPAVAPPAAGYAPAPAVAPPAAGYAPAPAVAPPAAGYAPAPAVAPPADMTVAYAPAPAVAPPAGVAPGVQPDPRFANPAGVPITDDEIPF
ncbi:MAG: hypothetical protein JKY94_17735 [Rhodobacteraceae bacterium]|nr:hypothetical protein [Paracoccaceae bacterium]